MSINAAVDAFGVRNASERRIAVADTGLGSWMILIDDRGSRRGVPTLTCTVRAVNRVRRASTASASSAPNELVRFSISSQILKPSGRNKTRALRMSREQKREVGPDVSSDSPWWGIDATPATPGPGVADELPFAFQPSGVPNLELEAFPIDLEPDKGVLPVTELGPPIAPLAFAAVRLDRNISEDSDRPLASWISAIMHPS